MSNYELRCLDCLASIDPTNFGRCNHLVSEVQCRGIRKHYRSTPTTNFSERKEIEKKLKYRKRKLYIEKSIVARNVISKKALVTNSSTFRFNIKSSFLKLLCTLARLFEITLLQPLRLNFYGINFPLHPPSPFSFPTFAVRTT